MMPTFDDSPTEELLDGRYRLGECVGSGGAAIVHRAEDLTLGRTVAIKIMRAGIEGPDAGARTRREIAALAALDHPGLVTLLDAKIVPGGPEYLVMEFVDGPSLRDLLDERRLTPQEVRDVTADLAAALSAAHRAGVVHRDVKPSNVLLAPTGVAAHPFQAKLADFGIAQLLDSSRLTSPGMVLGTPAYVAPEQARGAAPAPAADVFALGVVTVEMLTGRRPYSGMTPAEAVAARQSVAPQVPEGLDAAWTDLISRMTDLDPLIRPTAADVVERLRRLDPPEVDSARGSDTEDAEAASTRAMPVASDGSAPRRRRGRRGRLLAEAAAGALAALIAATIWTTGTAEPSTEGTAGRLVGSIAPRTTPQPTTAAATIAVATSEWPTAREAAQPAAVAGTSADTAQRGGAVAGQGRTVPPQAQTAKHEAPDVRRGGSAPASGRSR